MEYKKASAVWVPIVVSSLALMAGAAQGALIFDSGVVGFTASGTQFGRLSRNGVASDWSGPKAFPGVIGAPTARSYELFAVDVGAYPFIQIILDDPAAALFAAAYLDAYTPVNSAPNFGLDQGYLGDAGTSQPSGNPSFFQLAVSPDSQLLIAISELNPGGGSGEPFHLLVEGFYDTAYNDTPEPATGLMVLSGLTCFARAARRRPVARHDSANAASTR